MTLRRLLNLVVAVFVTAGLALAPLVAPAAMAKGKAVGMAEMSMSADMPCCPDQSSVDCQDCPLMAMVATVAGAAALPLSQLPSVFDIGLM